MIAWPFHLLDCCLVTDAGGAVVVTSAERARDLPKQPVYVLGTGEASTHVMVSQMPDFARWDAARIVGRARLRDGRRARTPTSTSRCSTTPSPSCRSWRSRRSASASRARAGAFVSGQRTAPGGAFPMNTNGGGLSYTHTGMYGIFTLIEAVRQLRGECGARQVAGREDGHLPRPRRHVQRRGDADRVDRASVTRRRRSLLYAHGRLPALRRHARRARRARRRRARDRRRRAARGRSRSC